MTLHAVFETEYRDENDNQLKSGDKYQNSEVWKNLTLSLNFPDKYY